MSATSPSRRTGRSLVDQVTSQLRQDIIAGRLERGERLTELRLASTYGVSRVPVREALRTLEGEGFVTSVTPRVRRVAGMSPEDAEDLFDVRATVESLAASRAALSATPAQLRVIRSILETGQEAVAQGRLEVLAQLNNDLHREIAEASQSTMLLALFNQIAHKVAWFYSDVVARRAHSSWHEHALIVEAIVAGDRDRSRRLMLEHIASSRDLVDPREAPDA